MAAILQLRQGSTSTYISQGPNIAEPFFDTGSNILVVGKSATEVIKLTKLDESNVGSFSITGDYTGSNLYLSGDITASNTLLSGDITIGGNIILGDQVQDTITVSGQFDSDLIPSASLEYDLGSTTKKWNHLYAVSASIDSIDLVSNLPQGVISSSAQVSLLGYDNYISWIANADNLNSIGITSNRVLYFEGGDGITTEARNPGNYYISFDLDTGSLHFTDAVAAVGAPLGTVSGSQQVIDLLPSGTISGSEQLPSGIVSSSSQITDASGIVSSSLQIEELLPIGVVSGSSQILDSSGILSSSYGVVFDSYSSSVDTEISSLQVSEAALNLVSHSHSNKTNLDTINQNLSTTSPVQFNSLQVGQISSTGNFDTTGTASFDSDVTIYGDLYIFGTESIVNSDNLSIADNMIYLNSGSSVTNPDLGFAGNYNDGTYAHAGLFRDASDNGIWKFYDGYTPEPEGSIDTSHVTFQYAPLRASEVTATLVSASDYQGDGSQLQFPGTNIVSSSQQVIDFLPTGTVSGSTQITDGSGIVSSSNQIDTGSIHFQRGVELYSINGINPASGIIGSADSLGVKIRGLSADGLSFDGPGNLIIDTGSDYFVSGAQEASLLGLPQGTVSGSDQVTQSLDTRYLEINGDNVLSSSNENFSDFSQSVDLRLLNTLSSGSETSQSLHTLVGNFPTSGSLGTSAFYNVSSSLADDPNVIPNVKAVYDYINNVVQAADITGVSASLGLFGGGNDGYVSLSLDTASIHFQEGVELYSSTLPVGTVSGSSQIEITQLSQINDTLFLQGTEVWSSTDSLLITPFAVDKRFDSKGVISGSSQVEITQLSQINDTLFLQGTETWSSTDSLLITPFAVDKRFDSKGLISGSSQITSLLPSGTVSGSTQTVDHIESSTLIAINQTSPSSLGANGELIINGTTNVYSGILTLESGSVKVYNQYSTESDKMINFLGGSGYGLFLQPDNNSSKAWVIDTDGDLVSQGTGDVYAQYFIGNIKDSTIVTSSVEDREIVFKNTNDKLDGSSIYTVPSTATIAINDSTPNSAGANGELIINGTTAGYSGILTQDIAGTTVYNQYATSGDGLVNFLAGSAYGLYFSVDGGTKSWTIDTDGDFVAGGNYDVYAQDFKATGDISGSNLYLTNNIQLGGNLIVGSSTITPTEFSYLNGVTSDIQTQINSLTGGTGSYVDLSSNQIISGTKTFNDIVVNGTGSFSYIESVSGTAKIIGDAYIVLNNDTPTERYAGIAVYDSGSAGVTASLEFDGQTNDWFYQYSDDGGVTSEHGAVLFGPEYSTKGTPTYPTNNTIQKGNGGHHLLDSNITDDGTAITLNSDTTVNGGLSATDITASNFVTTSELEVGYAAYMDTIYRSTADTNVYVNLDSTAINFGLGGTNELQIGGTETRIYGNLRLDGSLELGDGNTVNSTAAELNLLDGASANTVVNSKAVIYGSAGEIAATTVSATGDIVAYASSDRRLKDEITPISNPIEKINSIGGYSFVWNNEKQNIYRGKDYGVIAQEIEEILPELVDNRESGYKAVKYDRLVSLLIEGIKELSQEVKELKEKINRE